MGLAIYQIIQTPRFKSLTVKRYANDAKIVTDF